MIIFDEIITNIFPYKIPPKLIKFIKIKDKLHIIRPVVTIMHNQRESFLSVTISFLEINPLFLNFTET